MLASATSFSAGRAPKAMRGWRNIDRKRMLSASTACPPLLVPLNHKIQIEPPKRQIRQERKYRLSRQSAKKKDFFRDLLGVLGALAVKHSPRPPAVEIVQVKRTDSLPESLWGAHLNIQAAQLSEYNITVRGWALGRAAPVKQIQIRSGGLVVAAGKTDVKRPNVAQQFPEATGADMAGFHIEVNTLALPHQL